MSKSYVDAFLRVVDGFLTDAVHIDPNLQHGFKRERSRFRALASNHGVALFTLLLPEIDKLLCKSLDRGFLPISGLPLTGRIRGKSHIPALLQGLWQKLFEDNGVLKQDSDPTFVLILRSILCVGKKLEIDCSDAALYRTTKEFFDVESALPPAPPIWDGVEVVDARNQLGSVMDLCVAIGDLGGRTPTDPNLLTLCQQVADMVAADFGEYSPEENRFKHGPGATAEYGRGKSYKYRFPTWQPQLESRFPYDMCGVSNPALLLEDDYEWPEFREEPSRLVDVPKTQKAPRLIACEPAANQWCQQNLLSFLVDGMRSGRSTAGISVNFTRQDLSGDLALIASRTRSHATVDLKSASDRLTCWLVQRFWRSNLSTLSAIVACRTRYMRNDLDKTQASVIKLRKFATMGSALTFPIQSLAFYVIAVAAGLATEGTHANRSSLVAYSRRIRIYGDDLIVPVAWVAKLDELLSSLYLRINHDKTFHEGNFREACGVDGFRGYNVTPVKIRTLPQDSKPSTLVSMVDTANLLHKKGLWYAAKAYRSLGNGMDESIPVVRQGAGTWGDESFCSEVPPPRKRRWNEALQRMEGQVLQPKATRKAPHRFEGYENLLQFFTEDPYDPYGTRNGSFVSGVTPVVEAGFGRRWVPLADIC